MEIKEYLNYIFVSEIEFESRMQNKSSNCLLKIQLFNKDLFEDYDRTIYLELFYCTSESQIEAYTDDIIKFHYPYIRSYKNDMSISFNTLKDQIQELGFEFEPLSAPTGKSLYNGTYKLTNDSFTLKLTIDGVNWELLREEPDQTHEKQIKTIVCDRGFTSVLKIDLIKEMIQSFSVPNLDMVTLKNLDKLTYEELKEYGLTSLYLDEFIENRVKHVQDKDIVRKSLLDGSDYHYEQELRWYTVGKLINTLTNKNEGNYL